MKIKFLVIATLFSTIVFAQENNSYFGIKAGYNLSSLRSGDVDNRNGFHVGVYGEHQINNNVSFQPELIYSQLGFKDGDNQKIKLDYIQIPLMFKAYILKPLYVELGPQVGVTISKKEETDFIIGTSTKTSEPNTFDWGINGGVGFAINPGVTIGLRYYYGLSSAYKDLDEFNTLFQAFVGITL